MSKTVAFRYKIVQFESERFLEPSLMFYIDLANINQ